MGAEAANQVMSGEVATHVIPRRIARVERCETQQE